MRKLMILLAVAALTTFNSGCCCGKIRNWFHKGSPCGTAVSPAVLGAPLAMGTPMMSSPMPMMTSAPMCVEAQPQCVMPCDPCADPCANGQMMTGYLGGYTSGMAGCDCAGGSQGTFVPSGGVIVTPSPGGDN